MIYLNHAGTSWPKVAPVLEAQKKLFEESSSSWNDDFVRDRLEVARFFADDLVPERLLLTPGCTQSLQLAIGDLAISPGDKILTSGFEHHAMVRALETAVKRGARVVEVSSGEGSAFDLDVFVRELEGARLVACTHASNVSGEILPMREIIMQAAASNVPLLVDVAQSAGWLDLSHVFEGASMVAFAGHKALQAPWGIGGLYVRPGFVMSCGESACSIDDAAQTMPGYCDAGSVSRAALRGLVFGMRYLSERPARLAKARAQVSRLKRAVLNADVGARVLGAFDEGLRLPTVAFAGDRLRAFADALEAKGVRASFGFQCARRAHVRFGTEGEGALRFSVGPQTLDEDVERACFLIGEVAHGFR